MVRLAAAALCAVAFSAVALSADAKSAVREGDETCVISASNTCSLDSLTMSKTDGSTLVYPGGKTRCAYDDWTAPNTTFSTNATFFFQVFPTAEKKDKSKLVLYLQGGGACVDTNTCNFALQCSQQTFQPNALPLSIGILNRSEPTNLFNDWNIVHVPYCTGDIHIGNTSLVGKDQGFEIILQKDMCLNQNMSSHLNGYENAWSAIKWAAANYPDVTDLAFIGSSAGALGAQLLAKAVGDLWKFEEKKIRYSIVADSYVGVIPDSNPAGNLINFYKSCELPLQTSSDVVTKCLNSSGETAELLGPIYKSLPTANWLHVDSKGDSTQRQFYELVRQGVLSFPFPDMISVEDFYKNMTAILDEYKDDTSRLTAFFVDGTKHVFLTMNNYTLYPRTETGETLGSVMKSVLSINSSSSAQGTTAPAPAASSAAVSLRATASLFVLAVAAVFAW